jgi:hypothetical protein
LLHALKMVGSAIGTSPSSSGIASAKCLPLLLMPEQVVVLLEHGIQYNPSRNARFVSIPGLHV